MEHIQHHTRRVKSAIDQHYPNPYLGNDEDDGTNQHSPRQLHKLYLCMLSSLAQKYSEWKASSWPATPIKSLSPITPWKASPPKHPSNPQGTTPGREYHPTKQEEIIPPVDLVDSMVLQVHAPRQPGEMDHTYNQQQDASWHAQHIDAMHTKNMPHKL